MTTLRIATIASILCAAAIAPNAAAQDLRPPAGTTFSLNLGVADWNWAGPMFAIRADRQLWKPAFLVEGSLGVLQPYHPSSTNRPIIPEVQLQVQRPGRFAPYAGLGAGTYAGAYGSPFTQPRLTTSLAVGLRAWQVLPGTFVRVEARGRSIGSAVPEDGIELTTGLGWVF